MTEIGQHLREIGRTAHEQGRGESSCWLGVRAHDLGLGPPSVWSLRVARGSVVRGEDAGVVERPRQINVPERFLTIFVKG